MTRIEVVSVTYNARTFIDEFLKNFKAASDFCLGNGINLGLTILDNNSLDGTADFIEDYSDNIGLSPRIIRNKANVGSSAGYNQVIGSLRIDPSCLIVLMNNDTLFSEDFFYKLHAGWDGSSAIRSPTICCYPETGKIWFESAQLRDYSPTGIRLSNKLNVKITYCPSCCWLFTKKLFTDMGGFDERYFVYWEDADFCRRLRSRGLSIDVDSSMKLAHRVSASSSSESAVQQFSKNQIIYMSVHFGLVKHCVVLFIALGTALVRFAVGRENSVLTKIRITALVSTFVKIVLRGRRS